MKTKNFLYMLMPATLLSSVVASAALLGVPLEFPKLTYQGGTTFYDADTDEFSVNSTAIFLQETAVSPADFSVFGAVLLINIIVDENGTLISGTGGPDLSLTQGPDVLLTAEVDAFGFEDAGFSDAFDFEFSVTGGTLASKYPSGKVNVQLTSEASNFSDFREGFDGQAKGTLAQAPADQACELTLDKTCLVVTPPSADLKCQEKIEAFTMRYIGPDLANSTVEIVGGSGASVVYNNIDLISGLTVLTDATQNGFSIDANASQEQDLGSKTTLFINGVAEAIHTSCSAPFVAGAPAPLDNPKGNPSPNWFVENFRDRTDAITAPASDVFADECEIPLSDGTLCEKRPTELVFKYNGGDCTQSSNSQDSGKWDCEDFGPAGEPVDIVIFSGDKTYADETGVAIGQTIAGTSAMAGRDEFDSESNIQIRDASGNLLQEIVLHTSCSQDLSLGDKFGSLEVVGFTNPEQGMVQSGAEVIYKYKVTNLGPDTAINIMVTDDSLTPVDVPGSPIPSLIAGAMETLMTSVFIDGPVNGKATASGTTAAGAVCMDMDSTPVTVKMPPPCEIDSDSFELKDDEFKWKIANNGNDDATIESIEISWPAQFGSLTKVSFNGTIFDGDAAPTNVLLTTFKGDADDRLIKQGDTEELKLEFDDKFKGATPADIGVTINFEEGCSITFDGTNIPFGDCNGKIQKLEMIWDGSADPISVKAYDGDTGGPVVSEHLNVSPGTVVTVTGIGNGPNDVFWEVFDNSGTKIGESKFHLSCSDDAMDGPEDCGTPQGNGKGDDSGFINTWLLQGLMDEDGAFTCP